MCQCHMVLLLMLFFESNIITVNGGRIPDSVTSIKAYQMSPTVIYLKWDKPVNDYILTHYDIQYAEIQNGIVEEEDYLVSVNANATQAKLPPLKAHSKNRVYVYAIYTNIASIPTVVDVTLESISTYQPVQPKFVYELGKSKEQIRITWTPSSNHPGDAFFVKYRKKGQSQFVKTENVIDNFDIVINNLEKGQIYEFCIVTSYGGKREAESEIKEIST